jgi:hypothetical protein
MRWQRKRKVGWHRKFAWFPLQVPGKSGGKWWIWWEPYEYMKGAGRDEVADRRMVENTLERNERILRGVGGGGYEHMNYGGQHAMRKLIMDGLERVIDEELAKCPPLRSGESLTFTYTAKMP